MGFSSPLVQAPIDQVTWLPMGVFSLATMRKSFARYALLFSLLSRFSGQVPINLHSCRILKKTNVRSKGDCGKLDDQFPKNRCVNFQHEANAPYIQAVSCPDNVVFGIWGALDAWPLFCRELRCPSGRRGQDPRQSVWPPQSALSGEGELCGRHKVRLCERNG